MILINSPGGAAEQGQDGRLQHHAERPASPADATVRLRLAKIASQETDLTAAAIATSVIALLRRLEAQEAVR